MSSDESTSTQFSTTSNQAGQVSRKPKAPPPEQWEINLIGNFLLMLYHRLEITPQNDWLYKKSDMKQEFRQFVTPDLLKRLHAASGTDNIGTLLQRCKFLINTERKSPFYKIKKDTLFNFRNRKVFEQDKRRINDDEDLQANTGPDDILNNLLANQNLSSMQVTNEVDETSSVHELQYEGTLLQERRKNYFPNNMSCIICQEDFSTMTDYERHIQIHNDESDFEYVKEMSRFDSPIFKVNYQLCKNSHYFCFNLQTTSEDLIIERIIIVQSRSMFYVHNMRVPYAMPENKCEQFYVDSHLFTMFVEQPIVVIAHLENDKNNRIIEEHHFMLVSELPRVNFAIKPFQLPSNKTFRPLFQVPDYFPTLEIRDAIKDDFIYEKLMQTSSEFREYVRNEKILQPQTIGTTLTTLLQIEDMDTLKEYLSLMQQNVTLRGFDYNYNMKLRTNRRIHIENLLSVFDDVIITARNVQPDSDILLKLILQNKEDINPCDTYLGTIEDVSSGRVNFRCYKRLDLKRKYTVIFRPSRTLLRYQYRAMELLNVIIPHLTRFLFPTKLLIREPSTISLKLFNKSIANNPEQLQAVRNIAEGPRNDATYIIFGPPGTGKTTTLVEAILQVLKRKDTKILVTASSNSACDEVALRLCRTLPQLEDMPRTIVRIYAQTSEARLENFDDLLLEHSNMYNNVHFYPDIDVLHEYRIVVCTMSVVAKLATGKFGRKENGAGTQYTHLFIDEVAAATEVEALIPITSVVTPKSCLIIAGDHKQLGPIVKSKLAEQFNLGVSLMDRLLKRECYSVNTDTGDYDRSIQSRLRMNFRSHPAIVNLYSGMYYNHALEPMADMGNRFLTINTLKRERINP
ncbi:uncharacterized protein LOC133335062 [Musca vetustissima]|uniref:uncharacterized protein LOC133335062 n=1 Tax=Musca vetustissima TaxID=27455 RepID=UPI002AB791D7|nr:uncharacterized protein LOC133335062 [Musca vetustissima]